MYMEWLNDILNVLDKIQGLSAAALVCFSCVVVGYALRFIKRFPNDGIPLVVILWGCLFMIVLADPRPTTVLPRIWVVRNALVGLVIGFAAWMLHYAVLSKLEDFIASKFPSVGNTELFNKPQTPNTNDEKQTDSSSAPKP